MLFQLLTGGLESASINVSYYEALMQNGFPLARLIAMREED